MAWFVSKYKKGETRGEFNCVPCNRDDETIKQASMYTCLRPGCIVSQWYKHGINATRVTRTEYSQPCLPGDRNTSSPVIYRACNKAARRYVLFVWGNTRARERIKGFVLDETCRNVVNVGWRLACDFHSAISNE